MNDEGLKYPIGKFVKPDVITADILKKYIAEIRTLPARLIKEVESLNDAQLDTPYRPEGWTVRQVVHHIADSHMNSYIRYKLALTEEVPTVKPYFEDRWGELADSRKMPLWPSLKIIEGIHAHWVYLIDSLGSGELEKTFYHPESQKHIRLDENLGVYAWHGNHHLAQIINLKKSKGWE